VSRPDPLDRNRLETLPVWAQALVESMAAEIAGLRMERDGLRSAARFALEGGGEVLVTRRSGLTHSLSVSTDAGSLSFAPVSSSRADINVAPVIRKAELVGGQEIIIEAELPPRR
jgi:hypothetical protein